MLSATNLSLLSTTVKTMDPFCYQFLPRSTPLPYFGDFFSQFFAYYIPVHNIIIQPVIIFGLISNIMLMIVLTREKMMKNLSNVFLIGISIFDITTLVIYSFMAFPMTKFGTYSYRYNFWFIVLLPPYLIFRSASTWITVFLAFWRVILLHFPFQTMMKLDTRNAVKCIIFSSFISIIAITPHYLTFIVNHSACEIRKKIEHFYYVSYKCLLYQYSESNVDI